MDQARADNNPSSPKRQAHGTGPRSAARAVAELDDAIWTSIVEFMPIPKDLEPSDKEKHETAVAEIATTWQTLLHLRLVNKKLAALLHPVKNTALWRRLVLQSFDFSSQPTSNTDIYEADHYCLEEDIRDWGALAIFYRSTQYGFLTTLQRQPSEGEWPESEDPFSLFGDLVHLLQLPPGEGMGTHGEGGDTLVKYIVAPVDRDSRSASRRVRVMKTLGYVPRTWEQGRGIGKKWKGFKTEPDAFEAHVVDQDIGRDGEDEDREEDDEYHEEDEDWVEDEPLDEAEEFSFPDCSLRDARRLYRHIHQHYRDWRNVCCNSGDDGRTPVFYVGESKAAPHRWTGYTGLMCWT